MPPASYRRYPNRLYYFPLTFVQLLGLPLTQIQEIALQRLFDILSELYNIVIMWCNRNIFDKIFHANNESVRLLQCINGIAGVVLDLKLYLGIRVNQDIQLTLQLLDGIFILEMESKLGMAMNFISEQNSYRDLNVLRELASILDSTVYDLKSMADDINREIRHNELKVGARVDHITAQLEENLHYLSNSLAKEFWAKYFGKRHHITWVEFYKGFKTEYLNTMHTIQADLILEGIKLELDHFSNGIVHQLPFNNFCETI